MTQTLTEPRPQTVLDEIRDRTIERIKADTVVHDLALMYRTIERYERRREAEYNMAHVQDPFDGGRLS